jgi:signal transduction histidine kinase
MTFASDHKLDMEGLSSTSVRMLELREQVFDEWEARVRGGLEPASTLPRLLLIDSLPAFYDNIAAALTPAYPRESGVDGTTLAADHGSERARLTNYDHQALVGEYQKLRWVIFDVLDRQGLTLTVKEVQTINASIDSGIKEAVGGFALVHNALRERFAAALAHDLRGPLGVTSTALDLIMLVHDPVKVKTLAAKALENVHRMDAMIHELLDTMAFHSGEQLSLEISNFDMLEAAREVKLARAGAKTSGINVIGRSVHGWWDRSAITRALENLVSNAEKYGTEGDTITIRVSERQGRLLVFVHNQGSAIPFEEQDNIFKMYCRAASAKSAQRQGWGIGLPYVRAVAESHAGSIAVDSTAERGTTFTIDIPVDCRPYLGAPTVA